MFNRKETAEFEVTINKSRTYQYIKIENAGRRYFCLQQSPAVLAWILYFKIGTSRTTVRPHAKTFLIGLIASWLRYNYRLFRKNLILLIVFARHKYRFQGSDSIEHVHLPFYGQICVCVHRGYKIFNLSKGKVTKLFDPDVDAARIETQIDGLKSISHLHCAPSINNWNVLEKWYEEDYVSGCLEATHRPLDSASVVKKFNNDLVPQMTTLMLSQKPITTNALEYVDNIIRILSVSRIATRENLARHFRATKMFVDSLMERLHERGNYPVKLVFTHGDFIPDNMLKTKLGIRLIDWEDARRRSALFDFYSYFFYRAASKNVPVTNVAAEINEALPFCIASLSKDAEEIASSVLNLETVYRWLFYIEFVCRLVEREETDKNLNIPEILLLNLEAFNRYEEIRAVKPT